MKTVILMVLHVFGSSLVFRGTTARKGIPQLLFASRNNIRLVNVTSGKPNVTVVVKHLDNAAAVDFMYSEGYIFWRDREGIQRRDREGIQRAVINRTQQTRTGIIATGPFSPDDLACDWIGKNLYWTDVATKRIEVSNVDGSCRKVLYWEDLDQPQAIALDPFRGYMYWIDRGKVPKIERAGMDGSLSTRTVIVDENIYRPNGLTIDYDDEKLFWTDTINSYIHICNFDGTHRKIIINKDLSYPFHFTLYGENLYWKNWGTKALHTCNKRTGTEGKIILMDKRWSVDIHVFDANRQPEGENPCGSDNGGCSHLCLMSPMRPRYKCACPTWICLLSDQKTCADGTISTSTMEPRLDDMYSPNISAANDHGTVLPGNDRESWAKIGIILTASIFCCIVICIPILVILRRRKRRRRRNSAHKNCKVPAASGPNTFEMTETSITESLLGNIPVEDLHPQMCKKNKFKHDATITVVSGKQTEDYIGAKQESSHCKGLEEVSTDEAEEFYDLTMNIKSKSSKYDYKAEKLIGLKKKDTESIKFHCSDCNPGSANHQRLPEHKSKDIEVDLLDIKRNETTYQQSEGACGNDVKVLIVKPLAAPADEKREGTTSLQWNWDEIFRHLAKNLPTSDWQLFFNILYGNCHRLVNEGRDTGSYISRVENNVRRNGGGIETLMFELFKTWKQLMGSEVNIACIEQALEERSYNLTLEDFRTFMRNPPLLPAITNRKRCQSTVSLDMLCHLDNKALEYVPLIQPNYMNFMLPTVPQYAVPPFANRETQMITSGPIIQEMDDQHTDASSFQSSSAIHSSDTDSMLSPSDPNNCRKRKRLMSARDIQNDEKQVTPRKHRKMDKIELPWKWTKGRRKNRYKADTDSELHEMKQSMIEMTKLYLPLTEIPLQAKQYNVYLEHTIECIIKQTGEPRMKVLSLSHKDFCEKETFETNRNEKFYFLYSGDRCLVLRHPQYETLRLYADHARRNLVQDVKKKLGVEYKEPDALFLAYDGQPILKKRKVKKSRSIKGTAAPKETLTARGEEENYSSNSPESSAKSGDVCKDTRNRIHKHKRYGGASFDNMERNESKDVVTSSISFGEIALLHTSSTLKNQSEEFNQMVAHKEGCHATDTRNGEEESTFAKTDSKLLNKVFVPKYEEVKPMKDLQEKNFQINQCETQPVSIGKLNDKHSKCGTDQEMTDENISDVTNSDSFGTNKENYLKTNEGSLFGNNKNNISLTGTGISPSETKADIASEMTRENISKTAFNSSETALVAAETSSDKLDDALVYACITSIIHDKIGEKGSGADLDLELD